MCIFGTVPTSISRVFPAPNHYLAQQFENSFDPAAHWGILSSQTKIRYALSHAPVERNELDTYT